MNDMQPIPDGTAHGGDLEDAMQGLSELCSSLQESYQALSEKAERVDKELCISNHKLEQKVAELDATRDHLELILDTLPTGVVVFTETGTVSRVNDAALTILGRERESLVGHSWTAPVNGPESGRARIKLPSGDERTVFCRTSDVHPDLGGRGGAVTILDDRTEEDRLEKRVHRMDKMAALGTMAAGIAHEIRNPMNAIKGFAELLLRRATEGSTEQRWSSLIADGMREVDAIIASMLTFSEPEKLVLETVHTDELFDQAVERARLSMPDGVEPHSWQVEVVSELKCFPADHIKMRQALRNLIANAIQVQPKGGSVNVGVKLDQDDVVISVIDEGPGLPEGQEHQVVDPFFTTRAEGTGLGLALVHTIARLHGGQFEITARPDGRRGSLATIRFPFAKSH